MALSLLQRALLKSSRYLEEAFSEPGVLRTFEEELFNLKSASCLGSFETLTDANLGGQTTAALAFQEGGEEDGSLVFQGNFSTAIPPDANPKVRRLGQASFGSKEELGHYLWLGDYERQVASTINCRVKGDGRIYGMYLKTDSYFEGDGVNEIWQAHFQTEPGRWEDVRLAVVQFILTRDGYLTEEERIPNLRRVTSIGFSVMGGSYLQEDGPFQLSVSRLAAGYDTDRSSGNED